MILKRAGLDPGPRDAPGRPGDRPLDATGSASCCTRTCTSHAVTGFSAPTGANIRDDTPHPPGSEITTQVEPKFVKNYGPAGASSGDHTQTQPGGLPR